MTWTLADHARRDDSHPFQGRGRGWGLSANTIAELQTRARTMRNNPTEPEKRLWRHLSNGQVAGAKFRRQQVIGWHIADFVCPLAKLVVEVDGETHDDPAREQARDATLALRGYRVVHVTNREVMVDVAGVLTLIAHALRAAARPHPHPSPEGEGLDEVEAQKPFRNLEN